MRAEGAPVPGIFATDPAIPGGEGKDEARRVFHHQSGRWHRPNDPQDPETSRVHTVSNIAVLTLNAALVGAFAVDQAPLADLPVAPYMPLAMEALAGFSAERILAALRTKGTLTSFIGFSGSAISAWLGVASLQSFDGLQGFCGPIALGAGAAFSKELRTKTSV